MTPHPSFNPYAPPSSELSTAGGPLPRMKRPGSVKSALGLFIFISACCFMLYRDPPARAVTGANVDYLLLLISGGSAALALVMIFGKRRRFVYWLVTPALALVGYRHVLGALYIPPHTTAFQMGMKAGLSLLFLWFIFRFIFGQPSREYFGFSHAGSRDFMGRRKVYGADRRGSKVPRGR